MPSGDVVGGSKSVKSAISKSLNESKKQKQLVLLLLAHPRHEFATKNIYPHLPQWDLRSDKHLFFVVPGYQSKDGLVIDVSVHVKDGIEPLAFSEIEFNDVINWLEHSTTFSYSGRTTFVLFVAWRTPTQIDTTTVQVTTLDPTAVIDFDVEDAIESRVVTDTRVFFESLSKMAKEYVADDALWLTKDAVVTPQVEKAMVQMLTLGLSKYLPIPDGLKGARKASRLFQVRDRRRFDA